MTEYIPDWYIPDNKDAENEFAGYQISFDSQSYI